MYFVGSKVGDFVVRIRRQLPRVDDLADRIENVLPGDRDDAVRRVDHVERLVEDLVREVGQVVRNEDPLVDRELLKRVMNATVAKTGLGVDGKFKVSNMRSE